MAPQDTDNQDQAESQYADASASTGVGAMLMATRLRIGEDLRDVAKALHIRYIYLHAIEDGRYEDLPGAAYALGFIRSYADYLGLDIDEVVRRFKNEGTSEKATPSALVFPVPIPESSVPGGAVIFIALALAILAYGGWYLSTAKDGFLAELISPLPERLSTLLPDDEKTAPEPGTMEKSVDGQQAAQPDFAAAVAAVAGTVTEPAPQNIPDLVPDAAIGGVTPEPTVEAPVEQAIAKAEPIVHAALPKVDVTPVVAPEKVPLPRPVASTPKPVVPVVKPVLAKIAKPAVDVVQPKPVIAKVEAIAEPVVVPPVKEPEPVVTAVTSEAAIAKVETATAPVVEAIAPIKVEPAAKTRKGRVFGAAEGQFRIVIKALKNSWIQVRDDVANTLVLTRLLRAGDSYQVPDRQGLKLLTGNAGALEILVDGAAVPPVGDSGTVRRSVALDPDLLVQGKAVE